MLPLSVFIFLLIELIFVSYYDLKHKKILNLWPILNILVFVGALIFYQEIYKFELATFFYSLVFLAVGFSLFCIKIMGGGDAKFLFSFFLLIPSGLHHKALIALLYSTLMMGGSVFLFNLIKNGRMLYLHLSAGDVSIMKKVFGTKFPFAPVILLSWLLLGIEVGIINLWD